MRLRRMALKASGGRGRLRPVPNCCSAVLEPGSQLSVAKGEKAPANLTWKLECGCPWPVPQPWLPVGPLGSVDPLLGLAGQEGPGSLIQF